jgi:glycosyltransferase involved in cell wall biosynthesis
MKQVLMTMFTLTAGAGGITRVLMNRGRLLREAGIDARIALFAWDPGLKATVALLKQQGRLAADQPVLNLYVHYAAIADGAAQRDIEASSDGHAIRVRLDPTTGVKVEESYVSPAGNCYLRKRFSWETGGLEAIELHDRREGNPRLFSRMQDLYSHWLTELSCENRPCAIIADAPKSAPSVLNVRAKNVYRILTIHSNHFQAPYKYGGKLRDTYAGILRTFQQADALAVLTRQQRDDIELQFGRHANIHIIPNSVTAFPQVESVVKRDPMLVVAVARYHRKKGLHKVIEAFETVLRALPGARLELYGSGDQELPLRLLVAAKWMNHAISIHGYAVDVAQVLRRASVAVSASEFEGFGIGIAEALSLGTPVVGFDCPYGPREIICDGEDGYLVDDTEELAQRIIALLQNNAQARSMGEMAARNMQRFSAQSVTGKWLALFRALEPRSVRAASSTKLLVLNGSHGSSRQLPLLR